VAHAGRGSRCSGPPPRPAKRAHVIQVVPWVVLPQAQQGDAGAGAGAVHPDRAAERCGGSRWWGFDAGWGLGTRVGGCGDNVYDLALQVGLQPAGSGDSRLFVDQAAPTNSQTTSNPPPPPAPTRMSGGSASWVPPCSRCLGGAATSSTPPPWAPACGTCGGPAPRAYWR